MHKRIKERDSNMELMRVFSMFLVVLVHCCFFANGNPYNTLFLAPLSNFYYCSVQSLAVECVNCFILISGFFGIRFKLKGIINLLFILLFYKLLFLGLSVYTGSNVINLSPKGLVSYFFNLGADWFVWCYLLLMIFAPMINKFVTPENRREVNLFLVIYFVLELFSCFHTIDVMPFDDGYSFLSFIGLYILGRYYRLYISETLNSRKKIRLGLILYMGASLINTVLFFATAYVNSFLPLKINPIFSFYSNPLVIVASFGVLMFFSGFQFKSKLVNWLAKSSFAVYLIHLNPFVIPYFTDYARLIYQDSFPYMWALYLLFFCSTIYILCALIDQIRLSVWNYADRRLFK